MNSENFEKSIKKGADYRAETIRSLAEFMHDEYDKAAQKLGWKTQESCRVEFADLPQKNRETMLYVAGAVYRKFLEAEQPEPAGRLKAIEIINESIATHKDWAEFLEANPESPEQYKHIGNAKFHRDCIRSYETAISEIYYLQESRKRWKAMAKELRIELEAKDKALLKYGNHAPTCLYYPKLKGCSCGWLETKKQTLKGGD